MNTYRALTLIFLSLFFSKNVAAQYQIGDTLIEFIDPGDSARTISAHFFYPADSTGTGVPLAIDFRTNRSLPVIIFAHGFLMEPSYYSYLWEHLVPKGFLVALPATETGFSPSHEKLANDMGLINNELVAQDFGTRDYIPRLFRSLNGKVGYMGHSMGGGAAFLAAEKFYADALVTFAAAETTPSAIAAAGLLGGLTTPPASLTFTGDADCVTPEVGNHLDMYNNLGECKAYATILGGSHCQFANSNAICELGEVSCPPTISEADQHLTILQIATPFLEAHLKNDTVRWNEFLDLAPGGTFHELIIECDTNYPVGLNKPAAKTILLNPNPAKDFIDLDKFLLGDYTIYSIDGMEIKKGRLEGRRIDLAHVPIGSYLLLIQEKGSLKTHRGMFQVHR